MAMFKKLKSLFVIEEEEGIVLPKSSTPEVLESKKKQVAEIAVNEDVTAPDKFINSLLQAIESNNLEGFDYLEYKQSLKSLAGMNMDEGTRFNSAFAMSKTMGASKVKLLDSAKHYLNILAGEKEKFTTAYQNQQQKQISSQEEKLSLIEISVKKKEEQIKKLNEEINSLKKEFELKKNEINDASAKFALTRDQFFAAHKKVSEQIDADIERMNKYLTK